MKNEIFCENTGKPIAFPDHKSEIELSSTDAELSEILFSSESLKPWVMKITEGPQIIFNREDYPDWKPDDFTEAVIKTLGSIDLIKQTLKHLWKDDC